MAKVLITGASGFIAGHCIIEMLSHICGVAELFGSDSMQLSKEVDMFVSYEIIPKNTIIEIISKK